MISVKKIRDNFSAARRITRNTRIFRPSWLKNCLRRLLAEDMERMRSWMWDVEPAGCWLN